MTWADMFDGGTLMAVEIFGTVLLFLAGMCVTGFVLLATYLAGKLLQLLVRWSIRHLRAHAFDSRSTFYPATVGSTYERPAFHVSED